MLNRCMLVGACQDPVFTTQYMLLLYQHQELCGSQMLLLLWERALEMWTFYSNFTSVINYIGLFHARYIRLKGFYQLIQPWMVMLNSWIVERFLSRYTCD